MTKNQLSHQNASQDSPNAEEAAAQQFYQDWAKTINPALYTAWKDARNGVRTEAEQQKPYVDWRATLNPDRQAAVDEKLFTLWKRKLGQGVHKNMLDDDVRALWKDTLENVRPGTKDDALCAAWSTALGVERMAKVDNKRLHAKWCYLLDDVRDKENLAVAYKACTKSGDERKRSAYANYLASVGAKTFRLKHLFSEVRDETANAINAGVSVTMAQANPEKGSILGYLYFSIRSEQGASLRTHALPLSDNAVRAWAQARKIEKKAGHPVSEDAIVAELAETKHKNGTSVYSKKSIADAMRYRALGGGAFVSLDRPNGSGAEEDAQSLRAQRTEYQIVIEKAGNPASVVIAHDLKHKFMQAVQETLTEKQWKVIVMRLVEEKTLAETGKALGMSAQGAHNNEVYALKKLRENIAKFSNNF